MTAPASASTCTSLSAKRFVPRSMHGAARISQLFYLPAAPSLVKWRHCPGNQREDSSSGADLRTHRQRRHNCCVIRVIYHGSPSFSSAIPRRWTTSLFADSAVYAPVCVRSDSSPPLRSAPQCVCCVAKTADHECFRACCRSSRPQNWKENEVWRGTNLYWLPVPHGMFVFCCFFFFQCNGVTWKINMRRQSKRDGARSQSTFRWIGPWRRKPLPTRSL